jgi:hypothetical protein
MGVQLLALTLVRRGGSMIPIRSLNSWGAKVADVRDRPLGWDTDRFWRISDRSQQPGAYGLRAGAPKTTAPRETINRARIWVDTIRSPKCFWILYS